MKEAYCGADAFAFFSYEETEGIVVLEALSCGVLVVRDIPVYEGWLEEGINVYKASDTRSFQKKLEMIFSGECLELTSVGRILAEEHGIFQTGMLLNEIYQAERLWEKRKPENGG